MKESMPESKGHQYKIFKIKINPKVAKFISLFIIFLSTFYFLSIAFENYIPLFNMRSISATLSTILKYIGIPSSLKGNVLVFNNFSIEIVRQCTGIFEVMALSACILAYPASKEKKFAGIVFVIPMIYIFNMLRLIFLSILGIYYPYLFEAVHDYILQLTFVFLVVFFWIFWINKVVKEQEVVKNEKG